MAGKSGKKRKKDKNSPGSQSVQENKRTMSFNCVCTPPVQGMSQPQASGFNSHIMPATFTYNSSMFGPGPPNVSMSQPVSMPQPQSPVMPNSMSDQNYIGLILQRLDNMDKKLGQLDSIQLSITNITVKVSDIEGQVKALEQKVNLIESSRDFDTEAVENLNKKQKEIDSMMTKMKKMEQSAQENDLKAKILDMQCRSMRDNLIFYRIPEERNETDEDCVEKVLTLIQQQLEIQNAKNEIKLHRAHRIGRYNPSKVRPIVAKFAFYPDREKVRRNANKLKDTSYGISQQFPREIMDTRKKLVPIMKEARSSGKDAYINVDKLYINNELYTGSLP